MLMSYDLVYYGVNHIMQKQCGRIVAQSGLFVLHDTYSGRALCDSSVTTVHDACQSHLTRHSCDCHDTTTCVMLQLRVTRYNRA